MNRNGKTNEDLYLPDLDLQRNIKARISRLQQK